MDDHLVAAVANVDTKERLVDLHINKTRRGPFVLLAAKRIPAPRSDSRDAGIASAAEIVPEAFDRSSCGSFCGSWHVARAAK